VDLALGGWEASAILTAQGGFPLTPGYAIDSCVCGNNFNTANVLRNPNLPDSERTVNRWFDTSAFSAPAQFTVGNAGRGMIWGPALRSMDLTVSKFFNVNERIRVQFRAEAYNLTNSPYFANPNTTFGAGTFGRVTAVGNSPRLMQMAMKVVF